MGRRSVSVFGGMAMAGSRRSSGGKFVSVFTPLLKQRHRATLERDPVAAKRRRLARWGICPRISSPQAWQPGHGLGGCARGPGLLVDSDDEVSTAPRGRPVAPEVRLAERGTFRGSKG